MGRDFVDDQDQYDILSDGRSIQQFEVLKTNLSFSRKNPATTLG